MSDSLEMSDAIEMIRKSSEGIANRRDLKRIRQLRYTTRGFDLATWRSMCGLGWTSIRLSEERGGIGLGMSAYCALTEELGAALVPEPLISAVLSAALLDDAALSDHVIGNSLALPAWQDSRDAAVPTNGLRVDGDRLYGCKRYVQLAAGADSFLAIESNQCWVIPASDPSIDVEISQTQDGGHVATLRFDGTRARRIEVDAKPVFAEACLATSAYLLGICEAALERSIDYLKMRVQFGKSLSHFQALQHRCVELKLQAELTRASVLDAAQRWDRAPGVAESYAAISRSKARATTASLLVTRQAIQLHGGIGFTDEHDIGLYLRKAMVVAPQFGGAAFHRARFADLSIPMGVRA